MSEKNLLIAANKAAIDLIATNNTTLSVDAIKTRLIRIADDLKHAVEEDVPEQIEIEKR